MKGIHYDKFPQNAMDKMTGDAYGNGLAESCKAKGPDSFVQARALNSKRARCG
jgi:hypothetical protein